MHILFHFDSLNVIMPLQTQLCHTLSYSVYLYHPKSTTNKIKYFIRLLHYRTKRSPRPQTSCHKMSQGLWGCEGAALFPAHPLPGSLCVTPKPCLALQPHNKELPSSPVVQMWEITGATRVSLRCRKEPGFWGRTSSSLAGAETCAHILLPPCPCCPARQVFWLLGPESRGHCPTPLAHHIATSQICPASSVSALPFVFPSLCVSVLQDSSALSDFWVNTWLLSELLPGSILLATLWSHAQASSWPFPSGFFTVSPLSNE